MHLYLDNSFLNRPFDNFDVGSNRLEAEVLFFIIGLLERGDLILVNSSVIEYENSLNPIPERKAFVGEVLKLSRDYQNLNENIKRRAVSLEKRFKIASIDSLHLAAAEFAKVDFFITCDYNLVKRYKGKLKVVSPLDFIKYHENSR